MRQLTALPDRLALLQERLDALGGVLEREHPAELALQVAELKPDLELGIRDVGVTGQADGRDGRGNRGCGR